MRSEAAAAATCVSMTVTNFSGAAAAAGGVLQLVRQRPTSKPCAQTRDRTNNACCCLAFVNTPPMGA